MLEKYIELSNKLARRIERYEEEIRTKAPSLMITNEKRLIEEARLALADFLLNELPSVTK